MNDTKTEEIEQKKQEIEKAEEKDLVSVNSSESEQNNESKEKDKVSKPEEAKSEGWNETKLLVMFVGVSLIIEAILIYCQSGYSQLPVSVITALAGLFTAVIAWYLPNTPDEDVSDQELQSQQEIKPAQESKKTSDDVIEAKEQSEKETAKQPAAVTEAEKPTEAETTEASSQKDEKEAAGQDGQEETKAPEAKAELSWFQRLTQGLTKTRTGFIGKLKKLVLGSRKIDEDLLDELEETLYEADIGVKTTEELLDNLKKKVEEEDIKDPQIIYDALKEDLKGRLRKYKEAPAMNPDGLTLYMVIGVNGVGKTTTIAKLAHYFKSQGKKVVLAAGDTFRAAAIDQLCIWGKRAGVDVIHGNEGGDPGALVFDAIAAARKREADILIVDTAGRMHNKTNLMSELQKVKKIAAKESCGGPHEILLVIDATTGQNAVQQAKQFNEAVPITGIAVTKLDGTAKGGVLFAVEEEVSAPVKFIGVGEKMGDLMPFDPEEYLKALFSDDSEKTKESDYEVRK